MSQNEDLKIITSHTAKSKDSLHKVSTPHRTVVKYRGKSIFSKPSEDGNLDGDNDSGARDTSTLVGQLIDIQTGTFPQNIIEVGNQKEVQDKGLGTSKINKITKRKQRNRHKVTSKGTRKKHPQRDLISQHCRVRSVIQPKVARREVKSNLSVQPTANKTKDSIRIPSMSWFIKNCILPKKSKEIQQELTSMMNKSMGQHQSNLKDLHKRLMSKRRSEQVNTASAFKRKLSQPRLSKLELPRIFGGNKHREN